MRGTQPPRLMYSCGDDGALVRGSGQYARGMPTLEMYSTDLIENEPSLHEPVAFVIAIETAEESPFVGTLSSVLGPRFERVAVTVMSTVPGALDVVGR